MVIKQRSHTVEPVMGDQCTTPKSQKRGPSRQVIFQNRLVSMETLIWRNQFVISYSRLYCSLYIYSFLISRAKYEYIYFVHSKQTRFMFDQVYMQDTTGVVYKLYDIDTTTYIAVLTSPDINYMPVKCLP